MANVDTLPEILRPLMEGPSIETPRCAVCGAPWPLNRHHIVRRGAGKLFRDGREVPKPTVMLCGSGNGSGCHGLAHANRLHFRWVRAEQRFNRPAPPGSGHWEYLLLPEPTKYADALAMDGWGAAAEGQAVHVSGYEPSSGWNLPPGCFESDPRAPWNRPDPWEGRTCRECRFCGRVQGAGGEAVCARDAMTGGGPDVEAVDETSEACECFEFE